MSDTVRAKFTVASKTEYEGGTVGVVLRAVTGTSGEDKSFWEATPAGEINLSVLNKKAAEVFVPGMDFYVDFTPAPAKE